MFCVGDDTRNMCSNLNVMSGSINQYLSPKLNSGDYVTRNVHNWVHQLILHERKYVMQKMFPYLPKMRNKQYFLFAISQNITSLLCYVDCSAMVKAIYESFMPLTIPAGIHNRPFLIYTYK